MLSDHPSQCPVSPCSIRFKGKTTDFFSFNINPSYFNFENISVAKKVLDRPSHEFNQRPLKLSTYRERFGIIPLNHDPTQPCVQIPADIMVTGLDPNILQYWSDVPSAMTRLENELKKVHAKPEVSNSVGALRLVCTITKDNTDARSQVKDWASKAKETVTGATASILVRRRACLKKIWDTVCNEIRKIQQANRNVALIERADDSTIYIVGTASMVDSVYNQVDKMCVEFEQTSEHIKNMMELKGTDKAVFKKANLMEKLKQNHPKLNILLRKEDIELEGPARDLLDVQGKVHLFLKQIQTRKVDLTKGKMKVLQALLGQENSYLDRDLKQRTAVIQVEGASAVIYGIGQDLMKCEDILTTDIKEGSRKVSTDEQAALKGMLWKNFSASLSTKCEGVLFLELLENNSVIGISAYKADYDMVLENINQHIKKNTIKKLAVKMEGLEAAFMERRMKDQLREIERDFAAYCTKIELTNSGFQISGTEDGLSPMKQRIEKLKEEILTDKQSVTSPGMMNYFKNEEMGRLFIKHQEDAHQVLIHHGEPDPVRTDQVKEAVVKDLMILKPKETFPVNSSRMESPVTRPSFAMTNTAPTPRNAAEVEVKHPSGMKIKAVIGDLPTYQSDLIVNAANGKLKHVGGLAKAIVDKGNYLLEIMLCK